MKLLVLINVTSILLFLYSRHPFLYSLRYLLKLFLSMGYVQCLLNHHQYFCSSLINEHIIELWYFYKLISFSLHLNCFLYLLF